MKISFDKKKSTEALAAITQNTSELSKKVAAGVKSGTAAMVEKTKAGTAAVVEKTKSDAYARRLKKYNPLFPDQYKSEAFNLPNIIVIVDDAVRKDIDVCEGAIGWLGKEKEVEILYIYDEFVPFSGLRFVPTATCDAVYYVDSFDRNLFIKAEYYFKKIQEERAAELEQVARCLGAKWCSIYIDEKGKTVQKKKSMISTRENIKGVKSEESCEQSFSAHSKTENQTSNRITFQGSNIPQKPILKWFAYDSGIQELISGRISGGNAVLNKELKFKGSSFKTMSQKAACAMDCAIVATGSAKGKMSMESQVTKEQENELIFRVEF
jgi:hypothetical protein